MHGVTSDVGVMDARLVWAGDVPTLTDGAKDRQYRPDVIEYHRAKTLLLLNIPASPRRMNT
ncbi:MAG: hypothetical protein COC12_12990 [Rhodobacteraceae bacterium]|nr:MAG: hypothetical protein COC12_12990 [Paracoccaceae bacterium]